MIEVKVIKDSLSPNGIRLTTMQLKYPRFIHSEFMTHRVFSRNASSSRAIPVRKMVDQVRLDPAMPVHWGRNQPGMQAREELDEFEISRAKEWWFVAAEQAARAAEELHLIGAHKQVVNRILEPFQWIHVVVTSTEWDNFFALRDHPDAQPEIHMLAAKMREEMRGSTPVELCFGSWHLPYVTAEDLVSITRENPENWQLTARMVSAARCCRVSHLKHDGHPSTLAEDLALCNRLAGADPIHASPFEHQATPDRFGRIGAGEPTWVAPQLHGNFRGWIQHRKLIEQGVNY